MIVTPPPPQPPRTPGGVDQEVYALLVTYQALRIAIGHHVLAAIMPARRARTTPRVVKRAISNYVAKTATGRIRGPSRNLTIEIDILAVLDP